MAGFSRTALVPLIVAAGAFGIMTSPGIRAEGEIQNANTSQASPVPAALRSISQQQLVGAAGNAASWLPSNGSNAKTRYAPAKGSTPLARMLLARGAERDLRDDRGMPAKDIAEQTGAAKVAALLSKG
ncbi:hypothetical protein AWB79_04910 [Caballeronia hypogeia]|uniref:Uncharacterized protein n=1 Tax=Caballeronia hypogeia TaxID=1777140 RepID=A0A158C9C9_9BURK|nr:hypothetical protein AWB79_04910 [Caballeronia hypogeia]